MNREQGIFEPPPWRTVVAVQLQLFGELLGDGAGALRKRDVADVEREGAPHSHDIEAAMLKKAFVLGRDHCLPEYRDLRWVTDGIGNQVSASRHGRRRSDCS